MTKRVTIAVIKAILSLGGIIGINYLMTRYDIAVYILALALIVFFTIMFLNADQ